MRLFTDSLPHTFTPSSDIKQQLLDWALCHRRDRIFAKDEKIPIRPGLVYFLHSGVVRLEGTLKPEALLHLTSDPSPATDNDNSMFLGLIETGQPLYWESPQSLILEAQAHLDQTQVFWLYWSELNQWEGLSDLIGRAILRQHQHYLGWLSIFGQKRTIDRLFGFLVLLTQEYGIPTEDGLYFPYPLTHAQIGRAIGANRVTVTRLLGRLRQSGAIAFHDEQFFCLPFLSTKKGEEIPQNKEKL